MGQGDDRLRRLQELYRSLQQKPRGARPASRPPLDGALPEEEGGLTLRPPDVPVERPDRGSQPGTWAEVVEECRSCGEPVVASETVCPHCGAPRTRPPADVAPPQTTMLLPGELHGPPWLVRLSEFLSPVAAIETGTQVWVFFFLVVVCSIAALFVHQAVSVLYIPRETGIPLRNGILAFPLVLPLLRLAAEVLWHATVVPGLSATLVRILWSPEHHRVQLEVEIKADYRLRQRWRDALRAAFDVTEAPGPALLLDVETLPLPGGRQVNLSALFAVRRQEIRNVLVVLRLRDGRSVCLEAHRPSFRTQKCRRCRGEAPACPLCGGTGTIRVATP